MWSRAANIQASDGDPPANEAEYFVDARAAAAGLIAAISAKCSGQVFGPSVRAKCSGTKGPLPHPAQDRDK
jgi:hypothetical protein